MKKAKKTKLSAALLAGTAFLFTSVATHAATTALTIANTSGGTTNPNGWSSGFAFTVTETITVTELGKFDHASDGVGGTDVGLYNVGTGDLLASADLTGASFELATGPRAYFATIAPLVLTTGTECAIMAVTNGGASDLIAWGRGSTFASEINFVQGRANSGSTLTASYAQTHALGTDAFSGGTFKYEIGVVPEPSSLALIGFAGLAMVARRRR